MLLSHFEDTNVRRHISLGGLEGDFSDAMLIPSRIDYIPII